MSDNPQMITSKLTSSLYTEYATSPWHGFFQKCTVYHETERETRVRRIRGSPLRVLLFEMRARAPVPPSIALGTRPRPCRQSSLRCSRSRRSYFRRGPPVGSYFSQLA